MTTSLSTPTASLRDHQLEARLEALEESVQQAQRQLKWYRRASIGLAAIIVGGGTLAAMTPQAPVADVVRTRRLEVVDPQNRLVFAASANNLGGQIDFWDQAGHNTMRLSNNAFGGDVALWNDSGRNVAGIFATEEGSEISLWNSRGERSLRCVSRGSGGRVDAHDARDRVVASLASEIAGGAFFARGSVDEDVFRAGANADGGGMLTIARPETGSAIKAVAASDGGRLDWISASGVTAVTSQVDQRGAGMFAIADPNGVPMIAASSGLEGGLFSVSQATGTTAFSVASMKDMGGAIQLLNNMGRRVMLMGSREGAGVLHLMNTAGNPVVLLSANEDGRGGAFNIRNGRGIQVISAGADVKDSGVLKLSDADGKKSRTLVPGLERD